ncbi:MAG: TonB family protein, partial [Limnospira maxima]
EWVLSMLPDYPDLDTSQPRTISALYPAEACEQNLSGQALVGVMIGSGGGVIAGPRLLRGTGYPILDDAAVAAIRDIPFEGQGRPIAYQYDFNFDSENCRSVAPAPAAAPAPAPAPAASPELAPESVREPQPQPQQEFNPELAPESVREPEPQPEPEVHSGSILQQLQDSLENPEQFSEEFID